MDEAVFPAMCECYAEWNCCEEKSERVNIHSPEEGSEKNECGGREEGEDGELGRLKTVGSENRRKGRVLIDTELRFRVRNHGNWEPTSLGFWFWGFKLSHFNLHTQFFPHLTPFFYF